MGHPVRIQHNDRKSKRRVGFVYVYAIQKNIPPYSQGCWVTGSMVVLCAHSLSSSSSAWSARAGARAPRYLVQVSMHRLHSGNTVLNISRLLAVLGTSGTIQALDLSYLWWQTSSMAIISVFNIPVTFHTISSQLQITFLVQGKQLLFKLNMGIIP